MLSQTLALLPYTGFRALFLALKGLRRLSGKSMQTLARREGLLWSLDLGETIDLWIYLTGSFQRPSVDALRRLIRPGDVVLDIGANIGAHTLFIARAAGPTGQVHAFEPTPFAFQKLRRNLELNPLLGASVQAHQLELVAPGAASSLSEIYSSWPLEPTGKVHPCHGGALMATTGAAITTLDAFCSSHPIRRVDVIKLDVDGHECGVLGGAQHLLRTQRPAMILEISPCVYAAAAPHRFEDFIEILKALDYRLLDETHFQPLALDAARLRALVPPPGGINAVAVPAEFPMARLKKEHP